jgi:alcohol dehydrogenase
VDAYIRNSSSSRDNGLADGESSRWDRNISITTRLVDTITTPMLLKIVRSGKILPSKLVTHRFAMNDILKAYKVFGNAEKEGAIKVILVNDGPH